VTSRDRSGVIVGSGRVLWIPGATDFFGAKLPVFFAAQNVIRDMPCIF
jgi:hypothetical protein